MSTQRKQPYIASFRQTRPRAAGDVFPYIIALVGTFDDLRYHVIGMGFEIGELVSMSYQQAHDCAVRLLNNDCS